jgi:hypothetical protein
MQIRPEDPEPYYWIGVIDWTLAYRANAELRFEHNKANIRKQIKDEEPLPPSVRAEYAAKYGPIVDEGIKALQQAINLRPDYDDAMAYLNLLYRRKADMVESAEERASLIKQAEDLSDRVKEIKQKKMSEPSKA